MRKVLICSQYFEDWQKHTPNGKLVVKNCEFILENKLNNNQKIDFYIFFGSVENSRSLNIINKKNTLLVLQEPPSIRIYNQNYFDQFENICSYDPIIKHKKKNNFSPTLWIVGTNRNKNLSNKNLSYKDLYNFEYKKKKKISVIQSDKVLCKEHEIRSKIINGIVNEFKDQIDVFGAGFKKKTVSDKLCALKDYHYHISIENYFGNDYWTEKLADPLIARSNPIYYGCQNLSKYFKEKFYMLKIDDNYHNLKMIDYILNKKSDKFEFNNSRELIFTKYNILNFFCELIDKNYSKNKNLGFINPENKFTNFRDIFRRLFYFLEKNFL